MIDIIHTSLVDKETERKNFELLHEISFRYLLSKLSKHLLDIFKLANNTELSDSEDSRPFEVRKLLNMTCESFTFEPNDFTNAIKEHNVLLEALVGK